MTAKDALQAMAAMLEKAKTAEPEAKAKVIAADVLGVGFGQLTVYGEIDAQAWADMEAMAQRCAQGEPAAYVTGKAYFRHAVLAVSGDVLIPRQETELVAQHAIDKIKARAYTSVLDLCTGSGCIAISLAMETEAAIDAADISEAALGIAKRNAAANGAADKIRFIHSDIFSGIGAEYDMIVSNPPYVSEEEYSALDEGVRKFEPKNALTAGDGLDFYRVIARGAAAYIRRGGALVLEIGASQAGDVAKMLLQNGFDNIQTLKDYSGRDRIVTADRQ